MSVLIVNAEQVRALLPMAECVDAMEPAMIAASTGTVAIPPRLISPLIDESGFFALMPGSSAELGTYGAKVISLHPANPSQGLPAIQGFVTLFDHQTGAPVAIIEGAEVTGIRTAATSGLATRELARPDASSCGVFGNGVQAETHIDAMCAVRPIEEILIWARDPGKARDFAAGQAERTGRVVRVTEDPAEAAACDVVCTVTSSPEPVLNGDWVQPGAHVNLVGAHSLTTREADTELIAKAALYVDLMESCRNEGGDFMIPLKEGAIGEEALVGEIGQLLNGSIPGRADDQQITVYNSLGMTAQDLFAARHVYDRALETGVGLTVEL